MTNSSERKSATIYQFPAGGRGGLKAQRKEAMGATSHEREGAPRVAVGSGWYHDVAIQEAEHSRTR